MGKTIGSGDLKLAKLYSKKLQKLFVFMGIICGVLLFFTNGGIIRGSGSIAYSMKVDLISTWAIVIPLSMFMAFVVKASPAIVVCCLNADQIFKCVPAFLKCNYGHWIKTMTNIS